MCLYIGKLSGKIQSQTPPRKPITVYKEYISRGGILFSVVYEMRVRFRKGGWIRSNRETKDITLLEREGNQVCRGIHAYSRKPQSYGYVHVECVGYPEDFVARGTSGGVQSYVFTKLKMVRKL